MQSQKWDGRGRVPRRKDASDPRVLIGRILPLLQVLADARELSLRQGTPSPGEGKNEAEILPCYCQQRALARQSPGEIFASPSGLAVSLAPEASADGDRGRSRSKDGVR